MRFILDEQYKLNNATNRVQASTENRIELVLTLVAKLEQVLNNKILSTMKNNLHI